MAREPHLNGARAKLAAGEVALGVGVRLARTVDIAPIMRTAGFDWLFIDLEHGSLSLDDAAQMSVMALQAGITPIARVPAGEFGMAARILGSGALGLVMPHIDTADQAREVVAHLRYPPQGHRAVYGAMPHFGFRSTPVATASDILNRETLLAVMLETPAAIENADAIAAVAGIDVLFVGANDLSAEMGIPGDFRNPKMSAAFRRVVDAAKAHGKWSGLGGAYDPEIISGLVAAGLQFILAGTDLSFMMQGAGQKVEQMRKITGKAGAR